MFPFGLLSLSVLQFLVSSHTVRNFQFVFSARTRSKKFIDPSAIAVVFKGALFLTRARVLYSSLGQFLSLEPRFLVRN